MLQKICQTCKTSSKKGPNSLGLGFLSLDHAVDTWELIRDTWETDGGDLRDINFDNREQTLETLNAYCSPLLSIKIIYFPRNLSQLVLVVTTSTTRLVFWPKFALSVSAQVQVEHSSATNLYL